MINASPSLLDSNQPRILTPISFFDQSKSEYQALRMDHLQDLVRDHPSQEPDMLSGAYLSGTYYERQVSLSDLQSTYRGEEQYLASRNYRRHTQYRSARSSESRSYLMYHGTEIMTIGSRETNAREGGACRNHLCAQRHERDRLMSPGCKIRSLSGIGRHQPGGRKDPL